MSFYDDLEAAMDAGTEVVMRRLVEVSLPDGILRLWEGNGPLRTSDGNKWIGAGIGEESFLDIPELPDPRDGSSALLPFRLGYINEDSMAALRADERIVIGNPLNVWRCYIADGEGQRPLTAPAHPVRLKIVSTAFFRQRLKTESGEVLHYIVTANARSFEEQRSSTPRIALTDTSQQFRSKDRYDIDADRYAEFVHLQANIRHVIQ